MQLNASSGSTLAFITWCSAVAVLVVGSGHLASARLVSLEPEAESFDTAKQYEDDGNHGQTAEQEAKLAVLSSNFDELKAISQAHSNWLQRQESVMFEMKEDLRILKISVKALGEKVLDFEQKQQKSAKTKDGKEKEIEEKLEESSVQLVEARAELKRLEKQVYQLLREQEDERKREEAKAQQLAVIDGTCHDVMSKGSNEPGVYEMRVPSENEFGEENRGHTPADGSFTAFCTDTGETVINHQLGGSPSVLDHCRGGCTKRISVSYQNASLTNIRNLIQSSESCYQEITYSCLGAPLHGNDGSPKVTWTSWNGNKNHYWAGNGRDGGNGTCSCGVKASRSTCLDSSRSCNCDAGAPELTGDFGILTNMDDLPVTGFHYQGLKFSSQNASITLGPLKCKGRRQVQHPKTVKSCTDLKQLGHRQPGYFIVESTKEDRYDVVFCNLKRPTSDEKFQVSTGLTLGGPPPQSRKKEEPVDSGKAAPNGQGSSMPAIIFDVVRDKHLYDLGKILYTLTEVNIGGAMNNETGVFTAPVTGVYSFSLHAWNNLPVASDVYILKNGANIIGRAFSFAVGVYGTDFKTPLNTGDTVTTALVRGAIYGDVGKLTRFSGQLIYAPSGK